MNNMKNEMKNNKANNLRLGAVYINTNTGAPCRLVHIAPCEGVWLEAYDGQGYGETIKFDDCHYADMDEVEDYLADYRVFNGSDKAPSHKSFTDGDVIVERGFDSRDDVSYVGYYDDGYGNDVRCRD